MVVVVGGLNRFRFCKGLVAQSFTRGTTAPREGIKLARLISRLASASLLLSQLSQH